MPKKLKYRCAAAAEHTEASLTEFVQAVIDETAEPFYKSDPVPLGGDDKEEGLQIVVGKSVDEIVLDPTKDVLLEVGVYMIYLPGGAAKDYRRDQSGILVGQTAEVVGGLGGGW